MVGDAAKVHPPAAKLNEEQHVQPASQTVSTVKKSHAMIPAACWRRNDRQVVEVRRGARSRP